MPDILSLISSLRIWDFVDILLVSVALYYVLQWFKGSRAFQLFKGFVFIALVFLFSRLAHLYTIEWLIAQLAPMLATLLIVVFQPELRRGLEKLGRNFLVVIPDKTAELSIISQIVKALELLAAHKTGALIAIERSAGLSEYIETGVKLNADIDPELIVSLFHKKSLLHDGALIIQDQKISAMGCLLPLTDSKGLPSSVGTRHRAALGLSEVTDALVIVVSEETGYISIADNGQLNRKLDLPAVQSYLLKIYQKETSLFRRRLEKLFLAAKTRKAGTA
ncbi:MAG: diadenylate cyclase CdaA [Candidatus Margulisbacteria bacterium]|jgi:diadenylate cyclase|nr:diadenylate cyclase CdaA [Candidatus Margulisiibacteriota bacterium]